jgi:hypothetical protein
MALLFDVRLERRFAPMLVRWLYVGTLVLIGAMTLFGLLISWWLVRCPRTFAGCCDTPVGVRDGGACGLQSR